MKRIALALILCLAPLGCAHKASAPAPPISGQVNDFDGQSYRSLMTFQASLDSLKADIAKDPTNLTTLKPIVNQAGADYNLAMTTWQVYHAAAVAGQATSAQQAAVANSLNTVQADLQKAGK